MAGLVRQSNGLALLRNLIRGAASSLQSSLSSAVCKGVSRAKADAASSNAELLLLPISQSRSLSAHASWDYRGQRQIVPMGLKVPYVAVDAWVAPNAVLAGDVEVHDKASIWYGVVVRGDLNRITVGPWSSVGDKCVLHATESSPNVFSAETNIGKFVTIGGYSTLRSCIIEDEVVIGQRCTIMEGSFVEMHAILASGSVVPPGRRIPGGQIWAGNPARFVRDVTNDEIALIPKLAEEILEIAQTHGAQFLPYSTAYLEVEKLVAASKLAA